MMHGLPSERRRRGRVVLYMYGYDLPLLIWSIVHTQPAEDTPLSALALAELAERAGVSGMS